MLIWTFEGNTDQTVSTSTSRVLSPDRTWPDRWLSEMHESRKVGLGTTVEYIERKFKTKAQERHVAKKPWRSPGSNLRHQIA